MKGNFGRQTFSEFKFTSLLDLVRAGSGKPELSYVAVMWLLGASNDALSVPSSLADGCPSLSLILSEVSSC